ARGWRPAATGPGGTGTRSARARCRAAGAKSRAGTEFPWAWGEGYGSRVAGSAGADGQFGSTAPVSAQAPQLARSIHSGTGPSANSAGVGRGCQGRGNGYIFPL